MVALWSMIRVGRKDHRNGNGLGAMAEEGIGKNQKPASIPYIVTVGSVVRCQYRGSNKSQGKKDGQKGGIISGTSSKSLGTLPPTRMEKGRKIMVTLSSFILHVVLVDPCFRKSLGFAVSHKQRKQYSRNGFQEQ